MSDSFDLVVLGGGPNGLALAAYLARAGMRIVVLERRHEAGGGLLTEEVTLPGFLHNTHAVYMTMVDYAPIYSDLELERRYQVRHIHPELQFSLLLSGGRSVRLYSSVERTCESLAQFSRRDADAYRELSRSADRLVDELVAPATYVAPEPVLDQLVKLGETSIGREVLAQSEKSPLEIVQAHFEDEHVRALMLYVMTHWGVAYDEAGIGFLPLLYLNRASRYRLVQGGSHRVAQALHRIIHEEGSLVLTSQRVKRILVGDSGTSGVELEDGRRLLGKHGVASTLDPFQTFFDLIGEANLPAEFRERLKDWRWEASSLFGLHLALGEAPRFAVSDGPGADRALVTLLGYDSSADVVAEQDAVRSGRLDQAVRLACCFPSTHDPTQAPAGRHTGICTRIAPHRLSEGGAEGWYQLALKEQLAAECLDALSTHAPNLGREQVLWKYVSTPLDIENKNRAMVEGSIKHGRYTPFQMGYLRPNEACSRTQTPIDRLYLCGASCYPGGLVIFGPAYLAANHIAERAGVRKWWPEPEAVVRARRRGVL